VGQLPGSVAAGVPGVDVGLAAVRERPLPAIEPGQERDRLADLAAGLLGLPAGDRPAVGEAAQAPLDVPGLDTGEIAYSTVASSSETNARNVGISPG
jgi:hypothetical protein